KTIVVVVWHSALRRVASPRFHHNEVTFCDQAVRRCPDSAVDPGTQWTEQFYEDGLLPLVRPWPFRRAGNGPAEIVRHACNEGLGVAVRQLLKNLLYQLLVLFCSHFSCSLCARQDLAVPSSQ